MAAPILSVPEPDRPYTLYTDYCSLAISAVLEQLQSDGKSHVIHYASRTCNKAESQLCSTEGEVLALLYGVEKFHTYLAGTPFTIVTDNSALTYLETTKSQNAKLARWALRLANYDFRIKHRAGNSHGNADGLTRARQAAAPAKEVTTQ